MEPRLSLRERIESLPTGSEDKALRDIVIDLLKLDLTTLRTLRLRGKQDDYQDFRRLTEDHIGKIEHDPRLENFSEDIRVRQYVRMLSSKTLRPIVSRPIETQFYREAIYLRIMAYRGAKEEEDFRLAAYEESTQGYEQFDITELHHVVDLSQSLYDKVKDAAHRGYLEPELDRLKVLLQSIDDHIKDACEEMVIPNQPMVFSKDADRRYIFSPISPPPA
ncbi:hypothetical protein N7541_000025 [Penicillium brevicompactum]|uniref:Uncharacterized protein n=1 Tax=Penicillium brevicompactum TaxID=5074 RepID=A0A9W9V387_PENBR|nr:hypothetical protein N7541_000025 [Penicillium brevicompactum]